MTEVEQEHSQSLDSLHDAVYELKEQVDRIEQTFTLIVNLLNQSFEKEGANGK
jgi:hypothetical protein